MKYISVGVVITEGTEYRVTVCRGMNKFTLTGDHASIWLNGRLGFADTQKPTEDMALEFKAGWM